LQVLKIRVPGNITITFLLTPLKGGTFLGVIVSEAEYLQCSGITWDILIDLLRYVVVPLGWNHSSIAVHTLASIRTTSLGIHI